MSANAKPDFTVADYLLTRLKQLNVEHIFQIPGDYVKHFTQALEHFDGVNAIGAVNELDATYAADGYGRTRGLGAVSLQFGVSTFSALNAVAGAWVERSPIVVISASPSAQDRAVTEMYGVLFHHSTGNLNADQEVYEHVTIDSAMLDDATTAPEIIDRVLTSAISAKRPVYLAAFEDVWDYDCKQPGTYPLQPEHVTSNPSSLENALDAAWSQITKASHPLILAGVELLRFGLADLLSDLIEASGFLYTTTSLGKTVLDESHPNFIGTYSDLAAIDEVLEIVNKSDSFITLGTIITDDYLDFISKDYGQMIRVDTEHSRVGWEPFPNVTMRDFMQRLIERFEASSEFPKKFEHEKYKEPWNKNSDPKFKHEKDVLTYNRFFDRLMKFADENKLLPETIMNFGVSCGMYVGTNMNGLSQNGFIASAAWQCIGFETGVASGVALGSGKRAWTIAGDGAFMMMCQSLSTLVRNKLNAVIFVMSNGVYAIEQVYVNIKSFNPKGHPTNPSEGDPPFDKFDILADWDYVKLAEGFGAKGYKVTTLDELDDCLKEIKDSDKTSLVQVVIPYDDLPNQMNNLFNSNLV